MLNIAGAAHCVDHARKLGKNPIARGFDNAPAMLGNLGIDEFVPVRLECRERTFLVHPHQPAITGNVGREDGSQPPFSARHSHANCLIVSLG
jgi:hypothetical protein